MLVVMDRDLEAENVLNKLLIISNHPTLDSNVIEILDYFNQKLLAQEEINFSQSALIVCYVSIIYEKKMELLLKEYIRLCTSICTIHSESMEIGENDISSNVRKKLKANPAQNENDTNKSNNEVRVSIESNTNVLPNNVESNVSSLPKVQPKVVKPKKNNHVAIPNLSKEILQKLKINHCELIESAEECLKNMDKSHPLYRTLLKLGDETSRTKNLITFNHISLTGKSWNILLVLENLLKKYNSEDLSGRHEESKAQTECSTNDPPNSEVIVTTTVTDNNINSNTNVDKDATIENINMSMENMNKSIEFSIETENDTDNQISSLTENINNSTVNDNFDSQTSTESNINDITIESLPANTESTNSLEENCENIKKKLCLKQLIIPLKRLPEKNLKKKIWTIRRLCKEKNNSVKEIISKSFNLEIFENFAIKTYPIHENEYTLLQKELDPKTSLINLDNRLEPNINENAANVEITEDCHNIDLDKSTDFNIRQSCEIDTLAMTPDSGRFSITQTSDSEAENIDDNPSRGDSAVSFSFSSSSPNRSSEELLNSPFNKLKTTFPNTFAESERLEVLKSIIEEPVQELVIDEGYEEWKSSLEQKIEEQKTFNITEGRQEIFEKFNQIKKQKLNFVEICNNKSREEVARLFLSTLDLATSGKLIIEKNTPGEINSEGFYVQLVSNENLETHTDITSTPTFNCKLSKKRKLC